MIKIIGIICLTVAFLLAIVIIAIDENCKKNKKKEIIVNIFGIILILCVLLGFGLTAWKG